MSRTTESGADAEANFESDFESESKSVHASKSETDGGAAALLERYRSHVERLLEGLETLHALTGAESALRDLPGYRELKGRPWIGRDRQPWIVVTLFGPTGAGKSTVFRLLTGLQVPAGDAIRPVTFNPVIAVQEGAMDESMLAELFPAHQLELVADLDVLKKKDLPRETLFYSWYQPPSHSGGPGLILADVPDFDTVYQGNWEKAADMMRRAEVVLFLIYPAAYMDRSVIDHLAGCCTHAGRLAILFTKADSAEQVGLIWEDLCRKTAEAPELKRFQEEQRQDGRSLASFLSESTVYFSPYTSKPSLDAIGPVTPGAPEFTSLLTGLDGLQILLANLNEDTQLGIKSLETLRRAAEKQAAVFKECVERSDQSAREAAAIVAGTCFPAGRMSDVIFQVLREYRPGWVRVVGAPVSFVGTLVAKSHATLNRALRRNAQPMSRLEHDRVQQVLDELLTAWRADLPEANLTMERCRSARESMSKLPLPQPSADWELAVREAASQWIKANPWRTTVLGSVNEVLMMLGGTAVGLDLLMTGGQTSFWGGVILGKLGLVGAAGAGSTAAGALLAIYEKAGLQKVLETADHAWRAQRCDEIFQHLRKHLAGPLFRDEWDRRMKALQRAPMRSYQDSADRLKQLMKDSQSKP